MRHTNKQRAKDVEPDSRQASDMNDIKWREEFSRLTMTRMMRHRNMVIWLEGTTHLERSRCRWWGAVAGEVGSQGEQEGQEEVWVRG